MPLHKRCILIHIRREDLIERDCKGFDPNGKIEFRQ